MESDDRLLASIGLAYDNVREALDEIKATRTVVPLDALRDQAFVEHLRQRQFNRVLLVGLETAPGELEEIIVVPRGDVLWQIPLLQSGSSRIIGLTDQDLDHWGVTLRPGWRGWLVNTLDDRWEIHAVPQNLEAYIKSIFPGMPATRFTLGDVHQLIQVADIRLPTEQSPLPPTTLYRADYLGQMAGCVVPLARQKRILLILRDRGEAKLMREVLPRQGIYVPRGTLLTQMERLTKNGSGLAIGHEDQLISWVLQARAHSIQQPFDAVVAEAWPIDAPELIPPPTWEELKTLRVRPSQQRERVLTDNHAPLDDDTPGQTEEEERVLSLHTQFASWTEIWSERLKKHPNVLAPLVWAAQGLSGNPLLVLDPRLPPGRVKEIGKYTVQPLCLDLDEQAAGHALQGLVNKPGLGPCPKGNGVPPQELWNDLARNLFDLPGDLYEWQKDDLARIMLGGHKILTVEAPTGSGKSLLFQFPALVQGAHNGLLTLVISPLRALMHEQCQRLWQLGFVSTVEALSSDLPGYEVDEIYRRLADGQIHLLFVAPERFRSRRFRRALEERLRRDGHLQYWVFDEAHCISLWGHDFRPDFLYAAREAQRLRTRFSDNEVTPVLLLSATLTAQVIGELEEIFEPDDPTA